MSNDINSAVFTGRLTRDAELRYSNSGTAVCNFSVASNYSVKRGENWEEQVSFFDCILFARRAEALHKYLTKGQQVTIHAEARQERWEKDGQKRSAVKFYVQDVKLTGGSQQSGQQQAATEESALDDFEDDVPF